MNDSGALKKVATAAALVMLLVPFGCTTNVVSKGASGAHPDSGAPPASTADANEDGSAPASSVSTTDFADIHWWTPSCPGLVCYDVELSSDGTYRKQRIVLGSNTLFCEHGTWKVQDAATLEFVPCKGDPYQQSWSYSAGVFSLQGVKHEQDPGGTFNCGPNDC